MQPRQKVKPHREPDADDRGGPADGDDDDISSPKAIKAKLVAMLKAGK